MAFTTNSNHEVTFYNSPENPSITSVTYDGCCPENLPTGVKCNNLAITLNASVGLDIIYVILSETFTFFPDGYYHRRTHEFIQNFDPSTTNWSSGVAGLSINNSKVFYLGTHDFNPAATELNFGPTTEKFGQEGTNCDHGLCGYGSPGGELIYSKHCFAIVRGGPESPLTRIYIRSDSKIHGPMAQWFY